MSKYKLELNPNKGIEINKDRNIIRLLVLTEQGYVDNVITYTFLEFIEVMKHVSEDFI